MVITNGCSNLARLQLLLLFQNFVKGCLREFARMYFNIVFEIIFELKYLKPEILKEASVVFQENKSGSFRVIFCYFLRLFSD
jgi:hypothetical protein